MRPQQELFQFVALLIIDVFSPDSSTNFLENHEIMSTPEFCEEVQEKFLTELMTDDVHPNGLELLELAFDFSDPSAFEQIVDSTLKFGVVLLSGIFSPDYVTVNHPYKVQSNQTGRMTNSEFCGGVRANIVKVIGDTIMRSGITGIENIFEILNIGKVLRRVTDAHCDEIVMELKDFKSSPIWERVDYILTKFKSLTNEDGANGEITMIDEIRRMAALTNCFLEGLETLML